MVVYMVWDGSIPRIVAYHTTTYWWYGGQLQYGTIHRFMRVRPVRIICSRSHLFMSHHTTRHNEEYESSSPSAASGCTPFQ